MCVCVCASGLRVGRGQVRVGVRCIFSSLREYCVYACVCVCVDSALLFVRVNVR